MSILDQIIEKTKVRIAQDKKQGIPEPVCPLREPFQFETSLKSSGMSFICEVKRASPSKGIISPDFPYLDIAREYEAAGASAISVLTEPDFFMGANEYLAEIRRVVETPLLRKDFVIDAFQIAQAAALGADAVLLICAVLSEEQLKTYINEADRLGLSALVEAHDAAEVKKALAAGSRVIGVNNRDLKTFTVDTSNSIRLGRQIPKDIVFVSESGIKTPQDVAALEQNGIDAVLIGETLMGAADKKTALNTLMGGMQ